VPVLTLGWRVRRRSAHWWSREGRPRVWGRLKVTHRGGVDAMKRIEHVHRLVGLVNGRWTLALQPVPESQEDGLRSVTLRDLT
jgi:hypothetical protein